MNRYGSRKFIISLLSLSATTWALWEGLVDAEVFRTIVIAVVGLYGAANVGQKAVQK